MSEKGPIYGVELIESLPMSSGSMRQAMPSRADLEQVAKVNQRTVAGYEVLLNHYQSVIAEVERLREAIKKHHAQFAEESLQGERELWSTVGINVSEFPE